ncbi:hypothetical protein ACO0LF_26970 [Undibacterium sp. Di27W]|uniref:hypothetical protein n=1 Tax=Undibacterium sp. Di27W TaxID=3413036 RepID=UPI003BF056B0
MRLEHVDYHVFAHESAQDFSEDVSQWHQLDGQIKLSMEAGTALYISWGQGPLQYSIEVRETTFFHQELLHMVSMDKHPYWARFISHFIHWQFEDAQHQILLLSTGEEKIFLSSQYEDGMFQGDSVRVAQLKPL